MVDWIFLLLKIYKINWKKLSISIDIFFIFRYYIYRDDNNYQDKNDINEFTYWVF